MSPSPAKFVKQDSMGDRRIVHVLLARQDLHRSELHSGRTSGVACKCHGLQAGVCDLGRHVSVPLVVHLGAVIDVGKTGVNRVSGSP